MRTWFTRAARSRRGKGRLPSRRPAARPGLELLERREVLSTAFLETNLVSDVAGLAQTTDRALVNPWGLASGPGGPLWVANNNSGTSTIYNGLGVPQTPLSPVTIPPPAGSPAGTLASPTGTVFNGNGGFNVTENGVTGPSVFLFVTEDGGIAGWSPGVDFKHAVIAVDNFQGGNGAVYKGATLGTDPDGRQLLYVANFRAGTIDVYGTDLKPVTGLSAGAFTDPGLPAGYAPFNVQVLDGKLYVSYAVQNATRHDDLAGPHRGFVDVFNFDGSPGLPGKAVRLISHGVLDSPWGLAIAPPGFAGLSAPGGDPVLLVGNFGDGLIHAFDATTPGPGVGQLTDPDGEPIRIDGLWALKVGNGGMGGSSNTVYFTAGPFGESHGLFGSLATATPGSPEGTAESQWVQANADVVQRDAQQLVTDTSGGAPVATIKQDNQTLATDTHALVHAEEAFTDDTVSDSAP